MIIFCVVQCTNVTLGRVCNTGSVPVLATSPAQPVYLYFTALLMLHKGHIEFLVSHCAAVACCLVPSAQLDLSAATLGVLSNLRSASEEETVFLFVVRYYIDWHTCLRGN